MSRPGTPIVRRRLPRSRGFSRASWYAVASPWCSSDGCSVTSPPTATSSIAAGSRIYWNPRTRGSESGGGQRPQFLRTSSFSASLPVWRANRAPVSPQWVRNSGPARRAVLRTLHGRSAVDDVRRCRLARAVATIPERCWSWGGQQHPVPGRRIPALRDRDAVCDDAGIGCLGARLEATVYRMRRLATAHSRGWRLLRGLRRPRIVGCH